MKLLLTIMLVLGLAEARGQIGGQTANNNISTVVYARVDPTGLTGNGTGIRGVTQTNLTQDTTAIVQSFFAGGGVALPVNSQSQLATTRPAAATVLVNNGAKRLIDYRGQLVVERMRLAQLIASKSRDRQSSAIETAQVMAIERAIQQADNQIALRGFKDPSTQIPVEILPRIEHAVLRVSDSSHTHATGLFQRRPMTRSWK